MAKLSSSLEPLVVSAPFGNYYNFLGHVIGQDFTPTLGTFTWESRGFLAKPSAVR